MFVEEISFSSGPLEIRREPRIVVANTTSQLAADLLDAHRTIPLVVLTTGDSQDRDTFSLGKELADELCGLAQVVILNGWLAYRALLDELPEARIPRRGARLFWPGFGNRHDKLIHPWWTSVAIAKARPSFRASLFISLARLSVVSAPTDSESHELLTALRNERRAEQQSTLRSAEERGDLERVVATLRSQLEAEEAYVLELLQTNEELDNQIKQLERERDSYLGALQSINGSTNAEILSEEEELQDPADFSQLWKHLEDSSDDAITFTDNARRAWEKCGYPDPKRMRDALESLAIAAAEWKESKSNLGMSLTSWMTNQTGLTYAPDDEGLRREKKDLFVYNNETYNRKHHIKLDDNVSPNRVGRIYFAIDRENLRWIVDHVGLKLYGL